MNDKSKQKGGFIQGVPVPVAQPSDTKGCCGEAADSSAGGCCGESSGGNGGCCGESAGTSGGC